MLNNKEAILCATGALVVLVLVHGLIILPPPTIEGSGCLKQQQRSNSSSWKLHKPFVYLIQSSKPRYENRLLPNERRDVQMLTYKKQPPPSDEATRTNNSLMMMMLTPPPQDVIYRPKTTWTSGRNALLYHTMERAQREGHAGYEYYIFIDDDVLDMMQGQQKTGINPWTLWEDWLLETKPAVGYMCQWMHPYKLHLRVDANINAFHRSTLGLILPYAEVLDSQGIYFSNYVFHTIIAAVAACQRFSIYNSGVGMNTKKHNHRGGGTDYLRSLAWSIPQNYVATLFKNNTLPAKALFKMAAHDWKNDKEESYEYCCRLPGDTTLLSHTGPVDQAWIHRNMNVQHDHAQMLLAFHYQHQLWLDSIRQLNENDSPYGLEAACDIPNGSQNVTEMFATHGVVAKAWQYHP